MKLIFEADEQEYSMIVDKLGLVIGYEDPTSWNDSGIQLYPEVSFYERAIRKNPDIFITGPAMEKGKPIDEENNKYIYIKPGTKLTYKYKEFGNTYFDLGIGTLIGFSNLRYVKRYCKRIS